MDSGGSSADSSAVDIPEICIRPDENGGELRPYSKHSSSPPDSATLENSRGRGFDRQTRLLHLRNAGFRGAATISARRVTPAHVWPTNSRSSSRSRDGSPSYQAETDEVFRQKRNPSPSLGILEELSNTQRRRRASERMEGDVELTDLRGTLDAGHEQTKSWTLEADKENARSHTRRASAFGDQSLYDYVRNTRNTTPLTESTSREQPSTIRHIRGHHKRSSSLELAEYIEHLESQLAALQAQLQSLTSPARTRAQTAKLQSLTSENRLLRQELSDWEDKFSDRLRDEVNQRTELELSLKGRIRVLERDGERKDKRIAQLEWDLEESERKAKDLDGLRLENLTLDKRLSAVTQALALSPAKLQLSYDSPSLSGEIKGHGSRASSAVPGRQSSASPSISSSLDPLDSLDRSVTCGTCSSTTTEHPRKEAAGDYFAERLRHESGHARLSSDLNSVASDSGVSMSTGGTGSYFHSPSLSPAFPEDGWSPRPIQAPLSPSNRSGNAARRRRMRRFPSGSSQLKPLLLPTASFHGLSPTVTHFTASASFTPSFDWPSIQSPIAVPEQVPEQMEEVVGTPRASSGTQSLQSLSEKHSEVSSQRKPSFVHVDKIDILEDDEVEGLELVKVSNEVTPSGNKTRTLFSELGDADDITPYSSISSSAWPRNRYPRTRQSILPRSRPSSSGLYQQQLVISPIALHMSPPETPLSLRTPGMTPHFLHTIFSELWLNPIELARRVIRNGWAACVALRTELGRWLMGLLLGPTSQQAGLVRRRRSLKDRDRTASSTHAITSSTSSGKGAKHHREYVPSPLSLSSYSAQHHDNHKVHSQQADETPLARKTIADAGSRRPPALETHPASSSSSPPPSSRPVVVGRQHSLAANANRLSHSSWHSISHPSLNPSVAAHVARPSSPAAVTAGESASDASSSGDTRVSTHSHYASPLLTTAPGRCPLCIDGSGARAGMEAAFHQPALPVYHRLALWVKFTVAVVLVFGVALRYGPEALFVDGASGAERRRKRKRMVYGTEERKEVDDARENKESARGPVEGRVEELR